MFEVYGQINWRVNYEKLRVRKAKKKEGSLQRSFTFYVVIFIVVVVAKACVSIEL